jgi:hypothetical protein
METYHAVKAYRGVEVYLLVFLTSALMEMSCNLHDPDA